MSKLKVGVRSAPTAVPTARQRAAMAPGTDRAVDRSPRIRAREGQRTYKKQPVGGPGDYPYAAGYWSTFIGHP